MIHLRPYRRALCVALVLAALGAPGNASAQSAADPAGAEVRVQAAAARYLAAHFPTVAARLDARVLRLGADDVPAEAGLTLALPAADGVPTGTTRADLYADGVHTGSVLLYVAHYDSVLVARYPLGRGDALTADAVEAAWMETTRFHGEPARPAHLQTQETPTVRRALSAGEALRATDLAWPVAIGTGDPVRVRYDRRGVVMTLDGQAREPASIGDTLRVFSRATGATYRVRLTAPGEADWIETL